MTGPVLLVLTEFVSLMSYLRGGFIRLAGQTETRKAEETILGILDPPDTSTTLSTVA